MKSAKETHFCIRGLRPPHQIRRQNRCPYGSNSLATSSAISFANGHQLRSVIGDNLGGPNGCAIPLNRTTLLHTPLSVPSKMSRHFRQQVGSTCYAVPSILRTKLVQFVHNGSASGPFSCQSSPQVCGNNCREMCTYYAKKRRNGTQLLVRMGTGVKSIRDYDVIGTANIIFNPHCVVPYSVTTGSWAHPRLLYHSA